MSTQIFFFYFQFFLLSVFQQNLSSVKDISKSALTTLTTPLTVNHTQTSVSLAVTRAPPMSVSFELENHLRSSEW